MAARRKMKNRFRAKGFTLTKIIIDMVYISSLRAYLPWRRQFLTVFAHKSRSDPFEEPSTLPTKQLAGPARPSASLPGRCHKRPHGHRKALFNRNNNGRINPRGKSDLPIGRHLNGSTQPAPWLVHGAGETGNKNPMPGLGMQGKNQGRIPRRNAETKTSGLSVIGTEKRSDISGPPRGGFEHHSCPNGSC